MEIEKRKAGADLCEDQFWLVLAKPTIASIAILLDHIVLIAC